MLNSYLRFFFQATQLGKLLHDTPKMKSSPLIFIVLLSAALAQVASLSSPRAELLGRFQFKNAGFVSFFRNTSTRGVRYDMLVSSFGFLESDVAVVLDVGAQLKNVSAIKPISINKKMKWPNFVSGIPGKTWWSLLFT